MGSSEVGEALENLREEASAQVAKMVVGMIAEGFGMIAEGVDSLPSAPDGISGALVAEACDLAHQEDALNAQLKEIKARSGVIRAALCDQFLAAGVRNVKTVRGTVHLFPRSWYEVVALDGESPDAALARVVATLEETGHAEFVKRSVSVDGNGIATWAEEIVSTGGEFPAEVAALVKRETQFEARVRRS